MKGWMEIVKDGARKHGVCHLGERVLNLPDLLRFGVQILRGHVLESKRVGGCMDRTCTPLSHQKL